MHVKNAVGMTYFYTGKVYFVIGSAFFNNIFVTCEYNIHTVLARGIVCTPNDRKRRIVATECINGYFHFCSLLTLSENHFAERSASRLYLSFLSLIAVGSGGSIPKFAPIG